MTRWIMMIVDVFISLPAEGNGRLKRTCPPVWVPVEMSWKPCF
jgi:hypothetical protein